MASPEGQPVRLQATDKRQASRGPAAEPSRTEPPSPPSGPLPHFLHLTSDLAYTPTISLHPPTSTAPFPRPLPPSLQHMLASVGPKLLLQRESTLCIHGPSDHVHPWHHHPGPLTSPFFPALALCSLPSSPPSPLSATFSPQVSCSPPPTPHPPATKLLLLGAETRPFLRSLQAPVGRVGLHRPDRLQEPHSAKTSVLSKESPAWEEPLGSGGAWSSQRPRWPTWKAVTKFSCRQPRSGPSRVGGDSRDRSPARPWQTRFSTRERGPP